MLRTEYVRPVREILAGHAAARPTRIAFVDDTRTITYRELADSTARLAGHLQELGVGVGDRVLLYLDNRVEVAESYLGIPRAGAVAVCVNPASPVAEMAHAMVDSGARVVITDGAHLDAVRGSVAEAGLLAVLVVDPGPPDGANPGPPEGGAREMRYAELIDTPAPRPPRDCLGLDDTAWMLYTSGTTGRPKGVHLTQRGCFWVVAACWAPIGIGPDDVLLCPLPLFHSYALVLCVLGVAAVGASERILPRFSVDEVVRRFTGGPEGDVTVFPGVPTMFHYLVDRCGEHGLKAPGLRMCISAGAILQGAVNERFEKAFAVPLLDGYGITETSTMVTMNWPTGERVPGSCGLPLPGLGVRLVDPATLRDVLPGQDGEIWVQGPNVTPGYHNLPDATAAAIVDGWYRTGDLGRRDVHGYLTISGRTKELIIRGGENVYPAEVEDALMAGDMVADAAVVGVPHEYLGEVPVAFVVPRDPGAFDHEAVLAGARERLSSFKVPVRLVEVDEAIPRTGSGKILRFRLREQVPSVTNGR